MPLEAAGSGETLLALIAAVGSLAGMSAYVHGELRAKAKPRGTNLTAKRPLPCESAGDR